MQILMTSCHLIPTWHKWNANVNDIMMMWFASFMNLVTSHLGCMTCMHVHDAHALYKYGTSNYPSGLACTQANSNLEKITASCFQVLNAQNTNEHAKHGSHCISHQELYGLQ